MNPTAFFDKYAPAARASCLGTGLLPSVALAQAALESNWGESSLTRLGFNFGGVKAGSRWAGKTIKLPTREFVGGKYIRTWAVFRAYPNAQAYFDDRKRLFQTLSRYQAMFRVDTAQAEARVLGSSGWATDPRYGDKLVYLINAHGLTRYDS